MPHERRFRFGVQAQKGESARSWRELARRAEDLGYATLVMPDHFEDQFAPVPALAAAAESTTDLRLGSLVFGNDYKHPVVLAKEAATLDLMSDGRLELGLGAGWMNTDYERAGITKDRPGIRLDRLAEAITVIKGLLAEGPVHHHGDHYRIDGLEGLPKPVQRPHPPILVGGGGRRALTIAAQQADIVGVNPVLRSGAVDAEAARDGGGDPTDRKVAWVKEAAGERYADLEVNMLVFAVVVTDDRAGVMESLAPAFALEPAEVGNHALAWVGTLDQICDDLRARRERWDVSYLVVRADAMDTAAPIVAQLAGT